MSDNPLEITISLGGDVKASFTIDLSDIVAGLLPDDPAPLPDPPPDPVAPLPTSTPFVVAIWGQSEVDRILNTFSDGQAANVGIDHEPLVDQDRVTFWWHDRTLPGLSGVQSVRLSDATVQLGLVTRAMVAMANVFMRQLPGRDIKIIMHTQPGTSPVEIMDEAQANKRDWRDDWALSQAATADGHLVEYGFHSWFAAPGSWGDDYGQNMFAFLTGRDHVTGANLVYLQSDPITVNGINIQRTLRDIYPHNPKWIAVSGAHAFIPQQDMQNATTDATGKVRAGLVKKAEATASWRKVIRNPKLAAHFTPEVFALHGYANGVDKGDGTWTDHAHPSAETDAGLNRMARQIAHAVLRGAGVTSFPIPSLRRSQEAVDGSYVDFVSDAGPITTARRQNILDWTRSMTPERVYALGMAIQSGDFAVGCDDTPKMHWTEWEDRTGLVAMDLRPESDLIIENVDFTGTILAPRWGKVDLDNCLSGPPGSGRHFHLDVYDAHVTARRCSFFGPGDGTGAGTLARRRPDMGGGLRIYRCDFQGYCSDAVKISANDTLALSRLDAPTTYGVEPVKHVPGKAYKVGASVTRPDVDPGAFAFVWVNNTIGNTQAPDFSKEDGRLRGQVFNGWELRNPHSDNMTLVDAQNAIVFGNLINLDATRRVFVGSKAQNGTNANIHSAHSETYTGTLIACNTLLRAERDKGGTPISPVSGATVACNVIESIGHEQGRWIANTDVTFAPNWDATPKSGVRDFAEITPPSKAKVIPADWTMFDDFVSSLRGDFADAQRSLFGSAPHWTDVVGFQVDGQPAGHVEITNVGSVRVYANAGASITFGDGGASGFLTVDRDAFAALWDDYPIVDLVDGLPGVPVMVG